MRRRIATHNICTGLSHATNTTNDSVECRAYSRPKLVLSSSLGSSHEHGVLIVVHGRRVGTFDFRRARVARREHPPRAWLEAEKGNRVATTPRRESGHVPTALRLRLGVTLNNMNTGS
mmetsp:Transcript_1055/g.3517  ORF Transcript_1055/g.3517 Transcript_1055/m.3517 type:complete len:118 (-) Transcript_1055:930-1283(-)